MEETAGATARQNEGTTRAGIVFQGRARAQENCRKPIKFIDLLIIFYYVMLAAVVFASFADGAVSQHWKVGKKLPLQVQVGINLTTDFTTVHPELAH